MDANSQQPIKDVVVMRVSPNQESRPDDQPKGGQLMERTPDRVRTTDTGDFNLDSVRDFTPFGHASWYSVTVSFAHPAYKPLATTYTVADATNSVAGEPTVRAGNILLVPNTP